jgi:hypothetical protein
MSRHGAVMPPTSARVSWAATASAARAQASGSADSASRMLLRATWGWCSTVQRLKPVVSGFTTPRESTIPVARTRAAQSRRNCAARVPRWVPVSHSTSASTRSGSASASFWAIIPPMDSPTT